MQLINARTIIPIFLLFNLHFSYGSAIGPIKENQELRTTLETFIQTQHEALNGGNWSGEGYSPDMTQAQTEFLQMREQNGLSDHLMLPFIEKILVPKGSKILFFGDLHGDYKTVEETLEYFTKKGYLTKDAHNKTYRINHEQYPNFYIIFLGDYTDRGYHPQKTLLTIFKLKIHNQDNVYLVRGNHEDLQVNTKSSHQKTGIVHALKKSNQTNLLARLDLAYQYLPMAIYLGHVVDGQAQYLQLNHGGVELAFNPASYLKNDHSSHQYIQLPPPDLTTNIDWLINTKNFSATEEAVTLVKDPAKWTTDNGYMWGDFLTNEDERFFEFFSLSRRGSNFAFDLSKNPTEAWLEKISTDDAKVCGVFRAHQQDDPVIAHQIAQHGVAKLWQSNELEPTLQGMSQKMGETKVVTFDVAPLNSYYLKKVEGSLLPNFNLTANMGLLEIEGTYSNWGLSVYRMKAWGLDEDEDDLSRVIPYSIEPSFLPLKAPLLTSPFSFQDNSEWD